MIVLPNMGLVKWDEIGDVFSHEQLAANFQALDDHDHTPGSGLQIPYGGLANLAVGPENLRDEAFIASKLENGSIETAKLKDKSVTTPKLANSAVTEEQLANLATSTAKLANGAVTALKLATDAVETLKIKDKAVTDAKLEKPIIAGHITEAGAVGLGTGFTAERFETAKYRITLNTELAAEGIGIAVPVNNNRLVRNAVKGKKVFEFHFVNAAEVAQNCSFNFMIRVP